jgi:hypothetical protein
MNAGFFLGGVCIQVATNMFKAVQDVVGIPFSGTFKNHVLNEVGKAVFVLLFISGTRIYHKSTMGNQIC